MAPETRMPEPPTPLTAKTVVRTDFAQVRRGFDADEVTAHLGRVAEHVADLESTIADLRSQLREREGAASREELARSEAYETTAARVADLVRAFDQDMERLRAQSEAEADARLAEARANAERLDGEAEKLRTEAEAEAARILAEARDEAARVRSDAERRARDSIGSLDSRRAALLESMRHIRDGLQRTGESVDALLRRADGDVVIVDDAQQDESVPTVPEWEFYPRSD